jgi:bacteriocin-like protein
MRELNETREININELDQVSGGISLVYGKPEIVYAPQKPDGTANFRTGDPDEGGQFHFQARLK